MKSRPILFSAPMVRALLDGTKTQTRRAVKGSQIPKENAEGDGFLRWTAIGQNCRQFGFLVSGNTEDECASQLAEFGSCPYGKIGDRLWVREAIQASDGFDSPIQYVADGEIDFDSNWCWKRLKLPSIHCPRGMSRITLEITGVKVERLQDISEEDAIAEGVPKTWQYADTYLTPAGDFACAQVAFQRLWESINGPESWSANPWVWAISFKRVTP